MKQLYLLTADDLLGTNVNSENLQACGIDRVIVHITPSTLWKEYSNPDEFRSIIHYKILRIREHIREPFPLSIADKCFEWQINARRSFDKLSDPDWDKHKEIFKILGEELANFNCGFAMDLEDWSARFSVWPYNWIRFPAGILDPQCKEPPRTDRNAPRSVFEAPHKAWVAAYNIEMRVQEFLHYINPKHFSCFSYAGSTFYLWGHDRFIKEASKLVPTTYLIEDFYASTPPVKSVFEDQAKSRSRLNANQRKFYPVGMPARGINHRFKGYKLTIGIGAQTSHVINTNIMLKVNAAHGLSKFPTVDWLYHTRMDPPLSLSGIQKELKRIYGNQAD